MNEQPATGIRAWYAVNAPVLDRERRTELAEYFIENTRWNVDFGTMLALSTALAAGGLLLSSAAVVIGAMLVAPLMMPLLGAGYALVQANVVLFRQSVRTTFKGVVAALLLAAVIGLLTPSYEPTLEIESRGQVNLLDLVVAFISGAIGAYATGRPSLSGTIAGVAIAAALVPPLAVVGIAASYGRFALAGMAAALFFANFVAIILGAALVFRMLGVRSKTGGRHSPWGRRLTIYFILLAMAMSVPLGRRLISQVELGQARPALYPASLKVRRALQERLGQEPYIDLVFVGRHGVELEDGIVVSITCQELVSRDFEDELTQIVRSAAGGAVNVTVIATRTAWATREAKEIEVPEDEER
jgi:uncharacterized hydrophobic protein (TIGR00271 family)